MEFVINENLREKLDQDTLVEETLHRIEAAFEKMIPEKDKKMLNAMKKKEIDVIHSRLIHTEKQLSNDVQLPTYLNSTVLPFIAQDIGLLIRAATEHIRLVKLKT